MTSADEPNEETSTTAMVNLAGLIKSQPSPGASSLPAESLSPPENPDGGLLAPHTNPGLTKSHQDHLDDFLAITNPDFWANLDGLSPSQAAALSVGIDPDSLERLKDLQWADQMGEEEPEFDLGDKHARFSENLRTIQAAITVDALPLVNNLIPRKDLYPWLKTKGLFEPAQAGPQTNNVIDVFLESFLGADYQDYARLKLAILGAKRYATGQAKKQPEVVEYLGEVMGVGAGQSKEAREKIAYVAQPDSRGRPGRR